MEEFFPIPNFDGYFINKNGKVLSKKRKKEGKIMKQQKNKDGYMILNLCFDKKQKKFSVHRLLALTFIANPNNHKLVDHINRVRDDNRLENLRWINLCGNNQNANKRCNNKSGHKNIYLKKEKYKDKEYTRWCVDIRHNHEWICRTVRFKTLEKAIEHRDKILKELNREII